MHVCDVFSFGMMYPINDRISAKMQVGQVENNFKQLGIYENIFKMNTTIYG